MAAVMIVEDDEDLGAIYALALETAGHSIIGIAHDGDEAVRMFSASVTKPDIILMDHRMPRKNGIEATIEIRRIEADAKVIFASGDYTIEAEARALGICSFKKKPFSTKRLIENVRKHTNGDFPP